MPKVDEIPGLNLADEPYEVGLSGLTVATNIDHLRGGKTTRRPGRVQIYSGTPIAAAGDSAYFLFTEGGALKQLELDYTATVLVSDLADQERLHACRTPDGKIYWSTQREHGMLVQGLNWDWNIPRPLIPNAQPAAFGLLREARYLYALSFLRDGIEGPLSHTAVYEGQGGIDFTLLDDISALTEVDHVRLYLSTPHGTEMYQAGDFAIGTEPSYVGDGTELGIPADLDDFIPMPVGGPIRFFAGRLWIALDSSLVYSEEYHVMPRPTNFLGFGERVEDFGAVTDGLFVGTESRIYFIAGTNPKEMIPEEKASYGMIPGTLTTVDGRLLGEGIDGLVLMWASPRGICAGLPGGTMLNLSERRVNSLTGEKGTSMFRQFGGQNHFITVLQS
jgi:hypothetical protein